MDGCPTFAAKLRPSFRYDIKFVAWQLQECSQEHAVALRTAFLCVPVPVYFQCLVLKLHDERSIYNAHGEVSVAGTDFARVSLVFDLRLGPKIRAG